MKAGQAADATSPSVGWPAEGPVLESDPAENGRDSVTSPLLTATEVAELLGVPTSWVYQQSRAGRIPTVTLGRYRRYRREAIQAWVEQLEASAGRAQPKSVAGL